MGSSCEFSVPLYAKIACGVRSMAALRRRRVHRSVEGFERLVALDEDMRRTAMVAHAGRSSGVRARRPRGRGSGAARNAGLGRLRVRTGGDKLPGALALAPWGRGALAHNGFAAAAAVLHVAGSRDAGATIGIAHDATLRALGVLDLA